MFYGITLVGTHTGRSAPPEDTVNNQTIKKIAYLINDNTLAAAVEKAMANGHNQRVIATSIQRKTGLRFADAEHVAETHVNAVYDRQEAKDIADLEVTFRRFNKRMHAEGVRA